MCDTARKPLPPGVEPISAAEARRLIHHTSGPELEALLDRADAVRRAVHGDEVALCGITNAKSGRCAENCGFCSQSAHFPEADAPVFPLIAAEEMVSQAKAAEAAGAREFSIVTSGTRIAREEELAEIETAVRRMTSETALEPCASLGLMREPELVRLKAAGLKHYHHNLETARSHFGSVCTTHTYDQQLETIRDLGIDCVPVNFLNPRPGTPMAGLKAITAGECLAAVAVFRLMMPAANIFVMGGREVNLGESQHLIFRAGANGTMVGNYLTSAGRAPDQVLGMVQEQGLKLRGPEDGRPWSFHGEAPSEANWNQRALDGDKRSSKLPVVR